MDNIVTRDELKLIETPPATATFQPVAHYDLANSVSTISQDLLRGYQLVEENYTVARNGSQLFATLSFMGDVKDMRLAVGFTNSVDKSLALKFIIGSSITVCSNLMFEGSADSMKILRKHSKNILTTLENDIITLLYRATYCHGKLIEDADVMRRMPLDDDYAAMLTGLLYFRGVFSPRMLPVAKREWENPSHDFGGKTLWRYYMGASEALKQSAPANVVQRYVGLHKTVTGGAVVDNSIDLKKTYVSGREVWQ